MKTPQIILTSLILLFSLLLSAQNDRQWQWAHRAGGDGFNQNNDDEEGVDIVLDKDNNVYVCGHIFPLATFDTSQVDFNVTDLNIFLAKYSCEGELLWHRVFGSDRRDLVSGMTIDEDDNIYITGQIPQGQFSNAILGDDTLTSFGGLYISKFDSDGNNIWNKVSYSGAFGFHINKGPNGTLYVYGRAGQNEIQIFSQYTVGGIVGGRTFIIKMDTSGAIHWVKNYGDTTYAHKSFFNVQDMSVADNGDIYLAGYFNYDTLYFFSEVIVRKSDHSDIILAKLDSSGQFQWVQRAGGSGLGSLAYAVKAAEDNKIYVTGSFNDNEGDADFGNIVITQPIGGGGSAFLAQYNSDGTVEWVRTPDPIPNNSTSSSNCIGIVSSSDVVWGGLHSGVIIEGEVYENTQANGLAPFFARNTSDNTIVEGFQFGNQGGIGNINPSSIVGGHHNNIFFTGAFEERIVVDDIGDTINNDGGGDWDIIVAKYGSSDCSIPEDTLVDTNSVYSPMMHTYRSLSFSPNPVNGNDVTLQLAAPLKEKARARLYSSSGSTVWQGELSAGNTQILIPEKLPAGHYILELKTDQTSYTGKLMVLDGGR